MDVAVRLANSLFAGRRARVSAQGRRHKGLTVKRGFSLFLSKVQVLDEHDRLVGSFSQKFFSIGGKFDVLDAREKLLCTLRGKWTSWDFRFVQGERELARVSNKWAGLGKELFVSADNSMLAIDTAVPAEEDVRVLIMAACCASTWC